MNGVIPWECLPPAGCTVSLLSVLAMAAETEGFSYFRAGVAIKCKERAVGVQ